MENQNNKLLVNYNDIKESEQVITVSHRKIGHVARSSRNEDERFAKITLTHKSSEQTITGTIPKGFYSKKEFTLLKNKLKAKLLSMLEKKVKK